ncbi:MAG: hypothetical protein AAGA50_26685 [Pseudomonadota bacterium]
MKSGYTLIATLGLIVLISSLVVGMNSLVSGTLRKSSNARANLNVDLAVDSALSLSKAIILGNLSRPADDSSRMQFNGTAIRCSVFSDVAVIVKIQDVAGLMDLRFSSDQSISLLISNYSNLTASRSLLSSIRENSNSTRFLTAGDALIASGISPEEADWMSTFSTIHGRNTRLARDVTPPELIAVVSRGGITSNALFGANPTNSLFKVEVFAKPTRGPGVYSQAMISFEHSDGIRFRKVFEKRHRLPTQDSQKYDLQRTGGSPDEVKCGYN